MDTDAKKILEWMRAHNGITALEASDNLRILRLAARIWDMRDAGVKIADSWEYSYTPDGKVERKWKRYRVVEDA